MKMISARLLFVIGLIAAVGCAAPKPAVLAEQATINSRTNDQIGAGITIVSLTDNRPENSVLTDLNGLPFAGTDLMSWVETSLVSRGFTLALDEGAEQAQDSSQSCALHLYVRNADVKSQETSKKAVFVFQAEKVGDVGAKRVARGQDSNIYWMAGSKEPNNVLSKAFDKAVVKLVQVCRN